MDTDVNHRTAAVQRLARENSPGGNATTTKVRSFGVIHISEFPRVNEPLQCLGVSTKPALEPNREQVVMLAPDTMPDFNHLLGLHRVECHRLFAHDMQTSLEGTNRWFDMGERRGADAHRVEVGGLDHLFPTGEVMLEPVLFRNTLCP